MSSPLELAQTPLDADHAISAIARYYDLDFGHLHEDIELYANLASGLASGASVLELGAGTGRVATALADRGAKLTAVENNDAMIAAGAERYQAAGVDVVQQDMQQLDVGEDRFDLVICAGPGRATAAGPARAQRGGLGGGAASPAARVDAPPPRQRP